MDIKGKLVHVTRKELKRIAPELPIDDFSDIGEWYDALEEHLLEQGFILSDDEIDFIKEWSSNGSYYFKYNCAVVKTRKRNDKFSITEISIQYFGIKNSIMNDLDKLVYSLNNLSTFKDGNGNDQEDSVTAKKYLKEYIEKMKYVGVKNIKQLLK